MMSDKSKIEWTDATWNPIRGCSKVSPGCEHCYAMHVAARFAQPDEAYAGLAKRNPTNWTGHVRLIEPSLTLPLRWRRPRRVFVNSMSDLFQESVPDEWIDHIFAMMALSPQHTFQVLTKRAERMQAYVTSARSTDRIWDSFHRLVGPTISTADDVANWCRDSGVPERERNRRMRIIQHGGGFNFFRGNWPLPNVQLGVSVEDEPRWDERWPHLSNTPAAVRFVSIEPLLAPLALWTGGNGVRPDWIIVGGESGRGARPMHPQWARTIRDWCKVHDVPFFFKQWGEWDGSGKLYGKVEPRRINDVGQDITSAPELWCGDEDVTDAYVYRVGKKAAGRLLDGRTWDEFPTAEARDVGTAC